MKDDSQKANQGKDLTRRAFLRDGASAAAGFAAGLAALADQQAHAAEQGVSDLTAFRRGDAEGLPFEDQSFDALFSECSFCTFPDKTSAAEEMARVLRPGGRLGLTDVTVSGPLPEDLQNLLSWEAVWLPPPLRTST